ncbi:MAG: four helix bundle protein [Planctomycetota bacterium]
MGGKAVRDYRDLLVWQKGIAFVKDIYLATKRFPSDERFGLTDQMRRAAVSIPSNIAEGHARQHRKEFRQFLHITLGSLAELDTQLIVARDLEYISDEEVAGLGDKLTELRKMTCGLIAKLPVTPNPSSTVGELEWLHSPFGGKIDQKS